MGFPIGAGNGVKPIVGVRNESAMSVVRGASLRGEAPWPGRELYRGGQLSKFENIEIPKGKSSTWVLG